MTYRLNYELEKIKSPVRVIAPMKLEFENGEDLCAHEFDKYYLVDSIRAIDNIIELELVENKQINDTNWIGEEQVSFF